MSWSEKIFKESLVERSEEFVFLDPFASEFEFREGTIQFTGEVEAKDFTKGIVESLVTTLSHLEKELPKEKMLPLKLKAGIESSLEQHNEALKRLGVEAITSSIFKWIFPIQLIFRQNFSHREISEKVLKFLIKRVYCSFSELSLIFLDKFFVPNILVKKFSK